MEAGQNAVVILPLGRGQTRLQLKGLSSSGASCEYVTMPNQELRYSITGLLNIDTGLQQDTEYLLELLFVKLNAFPASHQFDHLCLKRLVNDWYPLGKLGDPIEAIAGGVAIDGGAELEAVGW